MPYFINSLMLYQPCAAKTYTSSKLMDHLSVLIRIMTHSLQPSNDSEKQQSPRYAELRKTRGPSITRGLVSTINTIREKRLARTIGKQRHATILRTLHLACVFSSSQNRM